MKRKIFFVFAGLIIFVTCFISSVKLHDYAYKQKLRKNLSKIEIGMTDKQVVEILGRPTNIWSSDTPLQAWCYDTDSISQTLEEQPEINCGNMLLEMSSSKDGKVVKIFDF